MKKLGCWTTACIFRLTSILNDIASKAHATASTHADESFQLAYCRNYRSYSLSDGMVFTFFAYGEALISLSAFAPLSSASGSNNGLFLSDSQYTTVLPARKAPKPAPSLSFWPSILATIIQFPPITICWIPPILVLLFKARNSRN